MLEGLEISEVTLSSVVQNTASARFDSEFYKKSYLNEDKKLLEKNSKKLSFLCNKIDVGFVSSMTPYYRENGITLLQTRNIEAFFVTEETTTKITPSFHDKLKKSQINYEDILIARSGSFGKASIYLKKEIVNSSDIIIIQAKKHKINPYLLTTFLNSSLGVNQMVRFASGGLQGHVNLTILEELQVPQISMNFQLLIEKILKESFSKLQNSKDIYTQAEILLLDTLGLTNFKSSTKKTNIKSLHESFYKTGRLDAEYYQKKYEEIISHITYQTHAALSDLVSIQKSIEPGSDNYTEDEEGLPFLRVADFSKFGITLPQKKLKKSFVSENRNKLENLKPKKNTILFSKDGSVGEAYCLREDATFVTSGAILHLTIKEPKKLLADYLTLVLNSQLVQMQAERDAGGSIILHWRISEIEKVLIPILDIKSQEKISNFISESFILKTESEKLLEIAKHAVEIAIEQDEKAAMKFLAKETKLNFENLKE